MPESQFSADILDQPDQTTTIGFSNQNQLY
jgi:hypothetical protein